MHQAPIRQTAYFILGLVIAATLPLAAAVSPRQTALFPDSVRNAPVRVIPVERESVPDGVRVVRDWTGTSCRSRLVNEGKTPARIKEVVLFDVPHDLPPETLLYGEGFTMLSQTAGTLGAPADLGLTDRGHYKIPQPNDATVVYGLLTFSPPQGENVLMAFASCKRFVGRFYMRPKSIQVVLDTEGLTLAPGQSWDLEELLVSTGKDRNVLLSGLAERICKNHPPLRLGTEPTGWCSWYCFGSRVTAKQVLDNLDVIAKDVPALKYVLIDDGYQPKMGDWLESGPAFKGGVQDVLKTIRERGFEPALWVAPFIAEKDSKLFQQHPDWFIKDDEGKPLSADRVTFKGWRRGPWYALDGTNPAVQQYLEALFRTLRRLWGVTFFKLDANFWGTMHGGKFHDSKATRVEAYRRGMEAIRKGAGDGFILGCNHPIWPSFGEIHGSRSSGDIRRAWKTFAGTAQQNLHRNWQNGRLWWNDPDCLLLTGNLPEDEYRFHATAIYATGGMLLSGDDLTKITPERLALLRKLERPTGQAAEFTDHTLSVGLVRLKERTVLCLLNWKDGPQTLSVRLPGPCRVTDFWTGKELGRREGTLEVPNIPGHAGRLLLCVPISE
jgi:alpha-galactosidase